MNSSLFGFRFHIATFKTTCLKFPYSIKEKYPQLTEDYFNTPSPPQPAMPLCEARFSSQTSTKATYCNRLDTAIGMRIHYLLLSQILMANL